jgi:hypothetical protein
MSFNRSTIVLIVILLASIVLSTVPAAAGYPGVNTGYPAMPAGASPGQVTGHVYKYVTTDAMANVYVAIVNAANTSMIYGTTTSDDTGRYRFIGIPSTGGGSAYRIVAKEAGYTNGVTEPFGIGSSDKAFVDVQILPATVTATPRPNLADGIVIGKVTEVGTGTPMVGVTVDIVNPSNEETVYYTTTTDQNGIYKFGNLSDFSTSYQVRATKNGYKNGYSLLFQAESGTTLDMNVVMDLKPPEITPFATANPYENLPTATPETQSSGLPIPGFELLLALISLAIVVAAAGRNK